MTQTTARNAFYAQSGGVTAVINASACGVIETARRHKRRIGNVYAGRNGIVGALTEDLIDTSKESAAAIRALRHTPVGRLRLGALQAQEVRGQPGAVRATDRGLQGARHRLLLLQRRRRLGGHLSQGLACSPTSWAIRSRRSTCRRRSTTTCRSPTAARASARSRNTSPVSIREAGFDVASMAETSTKVFVLEVMGRHAGWIAAAGGLAAEKAGDAPHIILFPEIPFDEEKFCARVQGMRREATATARSSSRKACATPKASSSPTRARATRSVMRSSAASRRSSHSSSRASSATSITGPSRTTCSGPRATSRRRSTSSRPMPSARPQSSSRSRATTR